MRRATILVVRQRFAFRCGYCGISETESGSTLTIDHYHPEAHGGTDVIDNLVYCCHACNEYKGDWWNPDGMERILHPEPDDLASHLLEQQDGTLLALTDTGAFHISHLRLNRPALVAQRQDRRVRQQERQTLQRILALVERTDQRVTALEFDVRKLTGTDILFGPEHAE